MRILQISDTHLGATLNARGPAGWCRADDHYAALEASLTPVFRDEVDLVVHAGDVFDRSSPPRRDVERAGALFNRVAKRVPVWGIAGNHDRRGIRRWLPHRALKFVDEPTRFEIHGLEVGLVPFRRRAEDFARDAARLGSVDLLVCHQAFHGSRVPRFMFRTGVQRDTIGPAHLPNGVFHIAAGHIHPRQVVRVGAATVVHGGSTERTSFSESAQVKGAVVWSFGSAVTWSFVDHPTRSMNPGVPGALVRCAPEEVSSVRRAQGIAVVHTSRRNRLPRPQGLPLG